MFLFKKRFGQHFLINHSVIERITSCFNNVESVIEIGPGDGALTQSLVKKVPCVQAIDIDIDAINSLKHLDIQLIHADILKYPLPNNVPLVGNLPYNIASKIVAKIVFKTVPYSVFMFQKEVADLLTGVQYSKLTVFAQSSYKISKLLDVSAHDFIPAPKVKSQVVVFEKIQQRTSCFLENLQQILSIVFHARRKMLRSLLKNHHSLRNNMQKLGVNLTLRAEELPKEIFYELAAMPNDSN